MLITFIGFMTGILIGLTGTGGGVLVTPLLLVLTPYPALILIGTDIVNGAFTKLVGVFEHRRLGQVRWRLASFLIAGTVPGTIGGILLLKHLKATMGGHQLDHLLRMVLGITLFCVAILLPLVRLGKLKPPKTWLDSPVFGARFNLIRGGRPGGIPGGHDLHRERKLADGLPAASNPVSAGRVGGNGYFLWTCHHGPGGIHARPDGPF